MCILFFHIDGNPGPDGYKLILASNRDEFYARPTAKAHAWKNTPWIFGGFDLEPGKEGGTWLGLSAKDGILKFGALLNLTGEARSADFLGRGSIVTNYLTGEKTNSEYCQELLDSHDKYSAFNFLSAELNKSNSSTLFFSNILPTVISYEEKRPHGFGNSLPSKPLQKVIEGELKFSQIINDVKNLTKDEIKSKCLELLKIKEKHWPDEELKRRAPKWGEYLSSVFVNVPNAGYGTRTHTVIIVDANNKVDIYEETMTSTDPEGEWDHTHIKANF
ncbi:TANGO2 family protein [Megaselia abdita]